MPILKKAEIDKGFTQIPNELLRRQDLSLPAKGLICYMLSCKDDWKFTIKGLSTTLNTSEHLIGKYLTELAEKGYHKKEAVKESGRIVEWKYYIADYPAFNVSPEKEPEEPNTPDPPKKKNLYQQCSDIVREEFIDEDVIEAVQAFLSVRIMRGRLSAKSWRSIIKELRTIAKTKDQALAVVNKACACGYMKFYPVNNFQKKNKFVDDMSPVVTDDIEGILKQKYMEEFSTVPKCDRPTFEEWRKDK